MGMFDTIKCEYPLPDKELQDEDFQTKDLACLLDQYTITKSGELIHHAVRYEEVPDEERAYYGKPEWDTMPLVQLRGCIKTIPTGDVKVSFHGDLKFYTGIGDPNEKDYKFYEYIARFTEGKLVRITKNKI